MNANEALKLLKIPKNFPITKEQVSKAYKLQAKENHPDVSGNEESMKQINEAHDWLNKYLDKVNEVNAKKDTDSVQDNLDDMTDVFVNAYYNATNRNNKRKLLNTFMDAIISYKSKMEEQNITEDMLRKMFHDKLNGFR